MSGRKKVLFLVLILCSVTALGGETWQQALDAGVRAPYDRPEHRAFDFWIGEWNMHWRGRPAEAFYHLDQGSWMQHRVFPILGGKALIELAWERDHPEAQVQRGFSIRYFDTAEQRWVMAQNWPSRGNPGAAFLDQLVGVMHHGRLTMYSAQNRAQPDGSTALEHRRYNFSDIGPNRFRWDGSNTRDRGQTWYTWYVVDAYRQRDLDPYGPAGTPWPGVTDQSLCPDAPGDFDALEGRWEGEAEAPGSDPGPARLAAGPVLDGCGRIAVLTTPQRRLFMAIGYGQRNQHWVIYRLDDRPGTEHAYLVSEHGGSGAVFEQAERLAIADEFTLFLEPENFGTASARERLTWEALGQQISLRFEARAGENAPWQVTERVSLRRAD